MRIVLFTIAILSLLEIVLLGLYSNPYFSKPLLGRFFPVLSRYYAVYDKKMIQAREECVEFDATLFYRLKPGHCRFENVEFDTEIRVNSLGVRDNEESLMRPEIIVLGDSFAMGWGVQDQESFPALLERRTGKRVLNLSVSSYGTARELLMYLRADRSALQWLVIQHHQNDEEENQQFLKAGGKLETSSETVLQKSFHLHDSWRRYSFGRLTYRLFPLFFRSDASKSFEEPVSCIGEVDSFLRVLKIFEREVPQRVNVLIFNARPDICIDFVEEFNRQVSEWKKKPLIMNLSNKLNRDRHYFVIDDHWNASGHSLVAEEISKIMNPN